MPETYLVELSPGTTGWKLGHRIHAIAHHYHIHGHIEENPHITLFGPFTMKEGVSVQDLFTRIEEVTRGFLSVPFRIDGWEFKEGMNGAVLAFRLIPSEELVALNKTIAGSFAELAGHTNHWDRNPLQKWFHITIANRLLPALAEKIFSDLSEEASRPLRQELCGTAPVLCRLQELLLRVLGCSPRFLFRPIIACDEGMRIRVMNEETILGDFDLTTRRWYFGDSALDRHGHEETLRQYRILRGFELHHQVNHMPGESFVISDLHLGHANIIKYCARPFLADNVQEMDRVLTQNWNASARPEDTVYYLGDLRYSRDACDARSYLQSLSGKINLIRGNHDRDLPDARDSMEIEYGGIPFLLIHDPCAAPPGTKRWVVHGHMHNNDLKEYPFINFKEKRINVSAEVIGYRPVSLRRIAALIREGEAAGRQKNILILPSSSRYSQNDDRSFSDC